ncbi:MAG: hypothetical protein ER33_10100 [Cyanobium sp. CACIAM 14]|nr:MAG: hypothetical protein ER33_10100 [Cyanobium sp. CACIAM 14]
MQSSYVKVPFAFSIVCGPLGATGPDAITNHSFANIKAIADSLANAQISAGIDPIGLENYPGLKSLVREGDPTAASSPQPVDFYSPDTFNFAILDVSADGQTLSVKSVGMNSTVQNAGIEYGNGPQARTIFSFDIAANQAPSAVNLYNIVGSLAENTDTSSRLRVADISVTDDGLGTNVLSLAGQDANYFEIVNGSLYLKAGTVLDYEAKWSFTVSLNVDDSAVGASPDATTQFMLTLTDQNEPPRFSGPVSYSVKESNTVGITGPSSSASPYVVSTSPDVQLTSILTTGDSIGGYRMVGIPDGLGAFDNGDGTFTVLMNHELGNTKGINRAHGAKGAFVSKWIISKSDLSVISGSDLMKTVYGWDATAQASSGPLTFAFNRFCSGDLPQVSAYYYDPTPDNPNSGDEVGTVDRIFMHGEEGGATGYQLGSVVTGVDAGKSYILGKFNLSTNGSGLTGVGAWENALANPFAQSKTVVIGNNDGGSGFMANSVSVYVGSKTNSGSAVDRAGLTNGVLKFIAVEGHSDSNGSTPEEYSNATTHTSVISSGTRFSLSSTASTTFSRPEDGAWNPLNPKQYYFVTTDRLDTASDGIGSQIGQSRLWRLTFDDITNPDAGGTIDLLIDGRTVDGEKVNMFDNITVNPSTGNLILLEDVGDAAHNGKVWEYNPATDTLTKIAQHDRARFGDIGVAATSPFNQDEETSGVIDVSSIHGAGTYLVVDQAHYPIDAVRNVQGFSNPDELVEGGQLMLLRTNVASGQQLVTTLRASDPEGNPLTYSISGGADASRFTVDAKTGALSFKVAPNYEAPSDANGDNLYQVTVAVSDGTNPPVNQALSVSVTNVNEAPINTTPQVVSVAENTSVVTKVCGSDPEGATLTYAINGGADASRFTIDPNTGDLSFLAPPDFEAPVDNGSNNSYFVTVTVSDGVNAPVNQNVRVLVTDLNEAPTGLALSATAFDENIPDGSLIATLTSSDPETSPQSFTYALVAGAGDTDNLAFYVSGNELHITRSPDYERKSSYDIRLRTTDQTGLSFERSAQLAVNDLPDSPSYTFTTSADTVYEGGALAIGVSSSNVAPGTQLYWSFSGSGITGADFGDGNLSGVVTLGADGRASFTKVIAADGVAEGDEVLGVKFFSDPARSQQLGSTLLVTLKEPSVGVVTDGPDIITGTTANDTISGIPTGSTLRGRGTVDKLTGGGGDDVFVLGDAAGVFYDDGNSSAQSTTDMAWITDFSAGDKILLHGISSDYQLSSVRYSGFRGVQINALLPGSNPEPIGFVQAATLATLNLSDPSQFIYRS